MENLRFKKKKKKHLHINDTNLEILKVKSFLCADVIVTYGW